MIGVGRAYTTVINTDVSRVKGNNESVTMLLMIRRMFIIPRVLGYVLVIFIYPRVNVHLWKWRFWEGNLPVIIMSFTSIIILVE